MPKLFAPEGVNSFSHAGHEFTVAEDGTVEVAEHVVEHLIPHGFVSGEAPPAPSEKITIGRDDMIAVLEALGVAANPAMRADKLVAALLAAVKKKPAKAATGATGAAGDGAGK
ncbi:hypothetical protein HAP48_0042475 [Bradyrhizobium septentrionale]|uniref:Uncharacterized protein n=1 Tax=Bradyrhizobium septentrionale TaxID=1404411 RepID=A0A974A368_9BRAD|nr:hypothetical protein [Bradyrhizobium septentrionale]UGY15125.1 hypothetical protein HAP48_0042475 [Bradyrhizobium septentrionale]UGY23730.1 hypothetical protein HU675_0038255 [Bradyrhizobium septentrionale]